MKRKSKKKLKIFVDGEVLVHDHFSGIGHYTAALLKAVDELLFDDAYAHVSLVIGSPRRVKHRLSRFKFENFGVRTMPFGHRITNGLKRRHKLFPIDLLFGKRVYLFPNYSSWPTLFSPNVPVIYDLSFIYHAEFVEPRNQSFLVDQVAQSIKRASKIVTISTNSKQEIIDHYKVKPNKVMIAYPAVDMRQFYKRSEQEISYIKAKYGLSGEYILFVGNIEPRKNLISLLRAYDELSPELQQQYGLLLVGAKGWLDSEIKELIIAMRLKGLRILQPNDYVPDADVAALFSGASAFAYVSRYEGFGIPPLEAMACGVPVVSSNNSSLPEAVGKAATMVNATDVKAIQKALAKVLSTPPTEAQLETGYKQVMKFDWKQSARELLRTLEEANQ